MSHMASQSYRLLVNSERDPFLFERRMHPGLLSDLVLTKRATLIAHQTPENGSRSDGVSRPSIGLGHQPVTSSFKGKLMRKSLANPLRIGYNQG